MNVFKKYFRTRVIKNIERQIARQYSESIQCFLSAPIIAQLDAHYKRQRDIQQKLDKNTRNRDKLANSRLWGNRFSADGYYRWDDELKDEYKERSLKIQKIYDLMGFKITENNLDKLKKEAVLFEKKNSVLDNSTREIIALENKLLPMAERQIVQAAAIAAGLGITFHAGASYTESLNVYEALRRVNSNFMELSNSDIWFETMLLSLINPDSYQGMVNLAKGAYFEQQVANDTGGLLHENFNTPETDMLLEGTLVQLKATDSEAIIDTVTPGVKVIATSEVASRTFAIDSGHTNKEITISTENALGGDVFDTSGSLMDGTMLLSGGVGVLASLRGVCAAGEYLERNPSKKTGNDLEDLEESLTHLIKASAIGLEVAALTTLKALPLLWNLILTVTRWGLNIIHIILYPFIKIFS